VWKIDSNCWISQGGALPASEEYTSGARSKYSKKIMLPTFIVLEVIPIICSMVLAGPKSDNPSGVSLNLALVCMFLVIGMRTIGAAMYDNNPHHNQKQFFGTDHLKKRYELTTLIFFVELCFAAVSEPRAFILWILHLLLVDCHGVLFILFQGKRFQSGSDVSKVRFAFHGGSTFAFWDILRRSYYWGWICEGYQIRCC
jgi:hypothetical protein